MLFIVPVDEEAAHAEDDVTFGQGLKCFHFHRRLKHLAFPPPSPLDPMAGEVGVSANLVVAVHKIRLATGQQKQSRALFAEKEAKQKLKQAVAQVKRLHRPRKSYGVC